MPTTVVPLNTMLADLDESLRTLLKRDLAKHGFDGVEIVFDAPDKEWSASLSSPTVNLFLYDLREALDRRPIDWWPDAGNGRRELRPPLRVDASYSVSAWTRAVEDEHRLLSQVMTILYAYPEMPKDMLAGTLADQNLQRYPLDTKVAQPRQDQKADFWTAVGGQYKASVDYIVTVSCESGTVFERGPAVRTQTVRFRNTDAPPSRLEEVNRLGGYVKDGNGDPVANAWVVLADVGFAATDKEGRFRFDKIKPGTYTAIARGPDGAETEAEVSVPGAMPELVLGASAKKPAKKSLTIKQQR